MKISGEYAKAFGTLQNKLKREFPKTKLTEPNDVPEDIIGILVLGILATDEKFSNAVAMLNQINDEMVDYNELRVTPASELTELLEAHLENPGKVAADLIKGLNETFKRFDTLDLTDFKEMTKADLSTLFEELPGCSDHGRCFMLLFAFEVSAIPLDNKMLDYLIDNKAMPPEVDLKTARNFMDRHLKAAETAPFYWQLRKASESGKKRKSAAGK